MLDVEERFVIRDLDYRGRKTRVGSFVQRYRQRRHSAIDYQSPLTYIKRMRPDLAENLHRES